MKKQFKQLWEGHRKAVITVSILAATAVTVFLFIHFTSETKPVAIVTEDPNEAAEPETIMEQTEEAMVESVDKQSPGNEDVSPDKNTAQQEQTKNKQEKDMKTEAVVLPDPQPEVKEQYEPISEGWKASKSVKGNITSDQKAAIDTMVESWKAGALSDAGLRDSIIGYLNEVGIAYMEVSVTSKGYALYEKIPEIDLRDGGNLYSFVGTYSTGRQNPDGTHKTVCYNWSAFVF